MFQKICSGEGFGKVLGEGVRRAAESVGKEAQAVEEETRILPYGPKVFTPSALLYAVEPWPLISSLHEMRKILTKWFKWYASAGKESYLSTDVLRGIGEKFWGSAKAADFSTDEGKALAAVKNQNRQYVKESLILCDFIWPVYEDVSSAEYVGDPTIESRLLSAVTGEEIDEAGLEARGEKIFTVNRAILLRDGKEGRGDDTLPDTQFMEREEMIADGFGMHNPELVLPGQGGQIISRKGKALERGKFELLKDEYYRLRGWDVSTGLLKRESLREMGLTDLIEPLGRKAT